MTREIKIEFHLIVTPYRAYVDPEDCVGMTREQIEQHIQEAVDEAARADVSAAADKLDLACRQIEEAVREIEAERKAEEAEDAAFDPAPVLSFDQSEKREAGDA